MSPREAAAALPPYRRWALLLLLLPLPAWPPVPSARLLLLFLQFESHWTGGGREGEGFRGVFGAALCEMRRLYEII